MAAAPDLEPASWLVRPSQFGMTTTPQWRTGEDAQAVGLILARIQHDSVVRFRDRMAAKGDQGDVDWRYATGLAKAMGVNVKTVNRIFQGRSPMSLKFAVAAAKALDLRIDLNLHPPAAEPTPEPTSGVNQSSTNSSSSTR